MINGEYPQFYSGTVNHETNPGICAAYGQSLTVNPGNWPSYPGKNQAQATQSLNSSASLKRYLALIPYNNHHLEPPTKMEFK